MIVIVGVTAVLISEPPAKAQAVIAAGPISRESKVGPYDLAITVDPARVGSNTIHLTLLDSTGQLAAVDEIGLSATLPAVDVGPLPFDSTPAGPGHVISRAEFPLAGDWQLEIDVRKGEFDEWRAFLDIPIRKD
jgi:copper transport protein